MGLHILCILFVFSFFSGIIHLFLERIKFSFIIGTMLWLVIIMVSHVLTSIEAGNGNRDVLIEKRENIYSLNPTISGNFILGSGSIDNSYSYFIKNDDGSKEKNTISSKGVKIIEDDFEQAYFQERTCKPKKILKYLSFAMVVDDMEFCNKQEQLGKYLFVPKGTIIEEFKAN